MNIDQELKIIKYEDDNKTIDVRVDYINKNVWLTQNEISKLYGISVPTIIKKINSINIDYNQKNAPTVSKIEIVQFEGERSIKRKINIYNQEIILLIGYRIKSNKVYKFKEWIDNLFKENNIIESPNNSQIYELIEFKDDDFSLTVNVSPSEETVWLSAEEISILFDRDYSTILKHIKNAMNEECFGATMAKFARVQTEGGRPITREIDHYNLDVILAVGYRVKSKRGILFRKWVNSVLKGYLLNGYSINDKRCLECKENIINLNNRVERLELLNDKENNFIIFEGDIVESYSFFVNLFYRAKKELIIIDNYADSFLLGMLTNIKVPITIYISSESRLKNAELNNNNINLIIQNKLHDRYVIIDDTLIYNLGTSFNSLAKKRSSVHLEKDLTKEFLLDGIE